MTSAKTEPKLYARVEGGAIYTQDENGQFLVIINQTALYDLLHPSDRDDMDEPAEKVWVFATAAEREQFLLERYKRVSREDLL